MSFNANFCNGNRWIYYNAKFLNGMYYIRVDFLMLLEAYRIRLNDHARWRWADGKLAFLVWVWTNRWAVQK